MPNKILVCLKRYLKKKEKKREADGHQIKGHILKKDIKSTGLHYYY